MAEWCNCGLCDLRRKEEFKAFLSRRGSWWGHRLVAWLKHP